MAKRPYYYRYDDHYRALYAQGIRYWSDGPDGGRAGIARAAERVREAVPSPGGKSVLDVGCGEGHLAEALIALGLYYTGIDCSAQAIAKACERAAERDLSATLHTADILELPAGLLAPPYDLVFEQSVLPMFVVDADRRRYLATVCTLLALDGRFVLTNEPRQDDVSTGPIGSLQEFEDAFGADLSRPREWEAWDGREWVQVALPAFAGRPQSRDGYLAEFRAAGFEVLSVHECGSAADKLDFVLRPDA
jgi:SAM-dependent methyltransferase